MKRKDVTRKTADQNETKLDTQNSTDKLKFDPTRVQTEAK
jgi:hypothetical protein